MIEASFSDETLMSYADGELDPAGMAEVETAIARDAALAERVEAFRSSRGWIKAASLASAASQVPDEMTRRILAMTAEAAASQRSSGAIRQAPSPSPANENMWGWLTARSAVAASIAALIAGAVGYGAGLGTRTGDTPLIVVAAATDRSIAARLSTIPSGERVALEGRSAEMEIVSTFRAGQTVCREFELDAGDESSVVVACRSGEGWTTNFAFVNASRSDEFVPASSVDAVDSYLSSIAAGEPLLPEEEAAVLQPR